MSHDHTHIGLIIKKYPAIANRFTSGFAQNTHFMLQALKQLPSTRVSYVITDANAVHESLCNQKAQGDNTPFVTVDDIDPNQPGFVPFDVLIQMEAFLTHELCASLKTRTSTTIINTITGIAMLGTFENILFDHVDYIGAYPTASYSQHLDGIWILPHHAYQKHYLETITKLPVTIIPYLYSPYFLEQHAKSIASNRNAPSPYYDPKRKKNIAKRTFASLQPTGCRKRASVSPHHPVHTAKNQLDGKSLLCETNVTQGIACMAATHR